ncbi:MAG: type II toxin-antitoxin system RelE/ParE family toxin [Nitrospira sp.]|nr:type II toxin-antitoxin system RelE/ParE family toxin [Nitrospira sp.]
MKQYEIEEYVTERGKVPFAEWLLHLKDKTGQAKVLARVHRASFGNFGDWKEIKGAKGLYEMREHYGPGYRIFYTLVGQKLIVLLAGSSKKDQKKAVAQAKKYLAEYAERTKP